MPARYSLVMVNVILLCLTLLIITFYTFIFPKKKINPLFLLLLLSFLPTISIWRTGVYQSGDFTLHIYRTVAFFQNLQQGIFFPKWAGLLNATYGYPLFVFIYPLPYYLLSVFHFFGFSYIISMKLFLTFVFLFSGISMYYLVKELSSQKAALVAGIFYLYTPFHLVDLHYRVDIGELLSFVFLPLVFLGVVKIKKTNRRSWVLFEAFCISLLILSHQAIALVSIPILFIYILFFLPKLNLKIFLSILFGIILTAFYWIPILLEKQHTASGIFPKSVYFEPLSVYIYSPWRYGLLFQGPNGELSFLIGYTQWIIVFLTILFLYKRRFSKTNRKLVLFFLSIFFATFSLLQKISEPVWHVFPILLNFQFAYRLLVIACFSLSVLAGIVLTIVKKMWIVYAICFLTIAITMLNWGNRTLFPDINDAYLIERTPQSTFEGEGLGPVVSKWVDQKHPWFRITPRVHLQAINGQVTIKEKKRTNEVHDYDVRAASNIYLKENTLYFPGWTVTDNGKEVPIDFKNKEYPGIITFHLAKGTHTVNVIYRNLFVQTMANFISILSLLILVMYVLSKVIHSFLRRFPSSVSKPI